MISLNKNNIVHINILLTSDIHGTVYPIQYRNNELAEIGLAKLVTRITQERNQHEHVIVIDNGDFIQGTPFTYFYAKYMHHTNNPMSLIANYIDYDVGVIGNHEFNYGMDVLNKFVLNANMPYLSANIISRHTKDPMSLNTYTLI